MYSADELTEVIPEAFELYTARGAALMEALFKFDVWRGDLSQMRRDDGVQILRDAPQEPTSTRFQRTVLVSQALRYLQPACQETLRLAYVVKLTPAEIASELGTTIGYASKFTNNCTRRIVDIVANVTQVAWEANAAAPNAKATPSSRKKRAKTLTKDRASLPAMPAWQVEHVKPKAGGRKHLPDGKHRR